MLHFHAHLQITGIGWCESRCGRMCRGQQCPCFWRYLRLWFGKYVTFAPCRPLIGKRCAAFRNRARFEIELQVGWVQLIEKPARLAIRWEEHTSELKSLMRISYAVLCLKQKITLILIENQTFLITHSL